MQLYKFITLNHEYFPLYVQVFPVVYEKGIKNNYPYLVNSEYITSDYI